MAQEKLKEYLDDILKRLTALLDKDFNEEKEFMDLRSKLQMVIRRVYPEYEKVEKKLICEHIFWNLDNNPNEFRQKSFLSDVNELINAVNTILEEDKIFGLKDFKPIKEKTETEVKVGIKDSFWRRKRNK